MKGLRSANLEFLSREKALEARLEDACQALTVLSNKVLALEMLRPMAPRSIRGQEVVAKLNRRALEEAINGERASG